MSALQAMLEYFYMEAGVYPPDLGDLGRVFNYNLRKSDRPLQIPVDPATNQPFVYTVDARNKSYVLRLPDPAAYGGVSFQLSSVDWAWMNMLAEQRRFEQMFLQTGDNIKGLAKQVELFAKDNGGKFPDTLDALYPKYIKRYPQDPLSGKNYVYSLQGQEYTISCPNPEQYGMKRLLYSSSQGMIVERLDGTSRAGSSTP